jgi:hypothetical protein
MLRDASSTLRPMALAALFVAVACTSTGGGSSSERVTSLQASRTWDSLSASDRDQVCDDVQDYFDQALTSEELDRLDCARSAIDVGTLDYSFTQDSASAVASCDTSLQECLADPPGSQTSPLSADCDFEPYVDCTFFIAEYEACITTQVDAVSEDITSFACAEVDWTDPGDVIGSLQTEQCQRLFDKCP